MQWFRIGICRSYLKSLTDRSVHESHAHTVVWECCKDDRQSQWGMAKCDPQPTLNPWSDRHQIWNTWLGRGHIPPKKFWDQSAQGFLPPTCAKSLKTFECLLAFFRFIRAPRDEPVWPIFALNTTDLFEKFEKFIMAPMGKFLQNFKLSLLWLFAK